MRDQEPIVETLKMKTLPEGNYGSRCGVYGVALNAPKPDEKPSGMQGNENEAMKNIKLYES
ncbi:MAG: hypothetical protein NO483_06665 [Candidatus Methanomethylicia archaeon]|nr:hypothetical protein [Candidatus Methanomethylicia archaeon]